MKIPKNEILRVSYMVKGAPVFLLTEDTSKHAFVLYETEGEDGKKLGRAQSPTELEEKYGVYERLAGKRKD